MFVVSTVVDSQSHKALLRREPSTLTLGPLDLLDKAQVVRRMLAVHRKTLDESPFNNQVNKEDELLDLCESLAICCEISLAKPDDLSDQSPVKRPLIPEVIL